MTRWLKCLATLKNKNIKNVINFRESMHRKLNWTIELMVANKIVAEICKFENVSKISRTKYSLKTARNKKYFLKDLMRFYEGQLKKVRPDEDKK